MTLSFLTLQSYHFSQCVPPNEILSDWLEPMIDTEPSAAETWPQFCEGFDYVYTPQLTFTDCPIFVWERERGRFNRAREGVSGTPSRARGERRRNHGRVRRSAGGVRRSTGRASGSSCLDANPAKVGFGPLLGFSCSCKLLLPIMFQPSLLPRIAVPSVRLRGDASCLSHD
jgi:hypothetical protein